MSDDVMIAVDPHKASNTAAVLDPVTRTLIESARFANSADGYEQLTGFAAALGSAPLGGGRMPRRGPVPGSAPGGRRGDGPGRARDAGRPGLRVYSQGHGRKTDKDDAVSIGLAALDGDGVAAGGSRRAPR